MSIEDNIKTVLEEFADRSEKELFKKTEAELEEYWFFKWDDSKSVEWNTYQFYEMLHLYSSFCRRWETEHNGYICVVERVRDKYLMPKIREFLAHMEFVTLNNNIM